MSFNKLIKVRVFFIAMTICLLALSGSAIAQGALKETVEGDKVAADTAQQINSSTGSIGETPVEVSETAADDPSTLEAAEVKDNSALYKSVSYYLLAFFILFCYVIRS